MANIQIKDGSENVYPKINNVIKQFYVSSSSPTFEGFLMDVIGDVYGNLADGEIGMAQGTWVGANNFIFTILRIAATDIYYRVTNDANMFIGRYRPGVDFQVHAVAMAN